MFAGCFYMVWDLFVFVLNHPATKLIWIRAHYPPLLPPPTRLMFCCFSTKAVVQERDDHLDQSVHDGSSSFINDDYLKSVSYNDTIPYVHPIHRGKVVKVYDGDTITIASKLFNHSATTVAAESPVYRFQVRLRGIDTPEMKTKSVVEKQLAQKSQTALSEFILHKIVSLADVGMDKYGRILANVYYNDTNISKWMITEGHAVVYDGGKKQIPDTWRSSGDGSSSTYV